MCAKNPLGKIVLKNLYKHGKNQKWLATEIGISTSAISAILSGRSNPSQKTLKKMSETLEVNIEELIECLHI